MNILDIIKDDRFERVYMVDVFEKEYRKLFGKSQPTYTKELEQLAINLELLDTQGPRALEQEQFHAIRGHTPLYSIRHISASNPRVLFVFTETDGAIVLLSCVLEKSTRDYDAAIKRAETRLQLLKEE